MTMFDSGLCGRVVKPYGANQPLLREALKRFVQDGWSFKSPISLNPTTVDESELLFIEVEEDPCIGDAEGCMKHFRDVGNAGIALSAMLVVLAALIDVYHDFLVRQISLIDQKEIN